MLERLVRLMAELAFMFGKPSEIDGMLEWPSPRILFGWCGRIVDERMADVPIV